MKNVCNFALDMEKELTVIEQAVLTWFNISRDELYSLKEVYPLSGARSAFMYLLYKNGVGFADIQGMFRYKSQRTVEFRIATVQSDITHHHGKYADDVENIEKIVSNLQNV